MTYTVPEADEVVETTVAEAMPEEFESEKVDSKEVDSEETVTEVDDTQEPVTEKKSGMLCKMWSTIGRRCVILYIMWSKSLGEF